MTRHVTACILNTMTTKRDNLYSDLLELIKSYNPEFAEEKECLWDIDAILDDMEEFEKDTAHSQKVQDEKWQ